MLSSIEYHMGSSSCVTESRSMAGEKIATALHKPNALVTSFTGLRGQRTTDDE
jgi:hypothetical protein